MLRVGAAVDQDIDLRGREFLRTPDDNAQQLRRMVRPIANLLDASTGLWIQHFAVLFETAQRLLDAFGVRQHHGRQIQTNVFRGSVELGSYVVRGVPRREAIAVVYRI